MDSSSIPYGDIIAIGAIAAFILLRYRAMLGERNERDETPHVRPMPVPEFERVIQLPSARPAPAQEKKEEIGEKYGTLAEGFVAMRTIDRDFAPDEFIQGARTAYEMVIEAFSKRDRATLKMLLSDAMYKSFDLSLTDAESANRYPDTTLVAIKKAEFMDAKVKGTVATITIDFTSEQIHLIRDRDGTILEGNPSQEELVEDTWVFERNLTSADPNWKIIET